MRPVPRREIDSRSLTISVAGIAPSSASERPAVAMATVCQVSRSTIARKSASTTGCRKPDRKRAVAVRLCASNSSQGLNSLNTSIGHSTTRPMPKAATRPRQAGSVWGRPLAIVQ